MPAYLAPPDTYQKLITSGASKALLSPLKIFVMACVAGVFISFGPIRALSIGLSCPSKAFILCKVFVTIEFMHPTDQSNNFSLIIKEKASSNPGQQKIVIGLFRLPFGLILVVNTGVELFTGNTAYMSAAMLEGKANLSQVSKNWICSFLGNLPCCLFVVLAMNACGLTTIANPAIAVATANTSLTFNQVRAFVCSQEIMVQILMWLWLLPWVLYGMDPG